MLVDVVNFNADASCLSSEAWLAALEGGQDSTLCRWLALYVGRNKPVAIGFTGASLADMRAFNPESLSLLAEHEEIFQILWRPFSHDVALFRSDEGFLCNVLLGKRAAERLIGRVSGFFLPPEFMQTNRQTTLLAEAGADATMILATRFSHEIADDLPTRPFQLAGIPDGVLPCLPLNGALTGAYLKTIQQLDPTCWSNVAREQVDWMMLWRDGESAFLLPDTVEREARFLDASTESRGPVSIADNLVQEPPRSYPVHPFSAWMNEMRMMWYLLRTRELEARVFANGSEPHAVARWLSCIGSDILSAVEKASSTVKLAGIDGSGPNEHRLMRSDRGFEGERWLELAEKRQIADSASSEAWMRKAAARETLALELL